MTPKRRVVVIGAGAAGTAAAFAASRQGADVTVLRGRGGATSLSSGALDPSLEADAAIGEFAEAWNEWVLAPGGCRVATLSGTLRRASGRDAAVLDVAPLRGDVGVLRISRRGWDAEGLSRAWNGDPWGIRVGIRFVPVDVAWLRTVDEHLLPDTDLATRCDDIERLTWLSERLSQALSLRDKVAVLVPPWLGTSADAPRRLTSVVGKPVGEPLSLPGGVAGLRFELRRERLFAKLGVAAREERAVAALPGVGVTLESGETLAADAVVLAMGGLVGGGLRWIPEGISTPGDAPSRAGFAITLAAPTIPGVDGRPLEAASSRFGASFADYAWGAGSMSAGFERVGVLSSSAGECLDADLAPVKGLYVAGDLVADRPRTLLEAVRSGLRAGHEAARADAR